MSSEKRPKIVPSKTRRIKLAACGNLYITVSYYEGKPYEIFTSIGKSGTCLQAMTEALTTSITMGLRNGVDAGIYIEHLKGIRCPSMTYCDGIEYLSCSDAIAKYLEEINQWLKQECVKDAVNNLPIQSQK